MSDSLRPIPGLPVPLDGKWCWDAPTDADRHGRRWIAAVLVWPATTPGLVCYRFLTPDVTPEEGPIPVGLLYRVFEAEGLDPAQGEWVRCTPSPTARGTGGTVYFIQGEKGGPIKIGFTSGPVERRLSRIQTGHPHALRVLLLLPGSQGLEREMHARFAAHRCHGEWFEAADELLAFIAERGGRP